MRRVKSRELEESKEPTESKTAKFKKLAESKTFKFNKSAESNYCRVHKIRAETKRGKFKEPTLSKEPARSRTAK